MQTNKHLPKYKVKAGAVIDELKKNNRMLVDGFPFVLDLDNSYGAEFVDARDGRKYIDFFTCFASMPIGLNHPKMLDEAFINYIGRIAINKPSNSDIYSEAMATFVKTFFNIAVPDYFIHSFYISGGALAVENALKTAFDWKVKKNFRKGYTTEVGTKILHFRQAFHGRSGYTMSLTNTDPAKVNYYPKFDWPRVDNPFIVFPETKENIELTIEKEKIAIEQIKKAFINNKDDIAAIILEPIQGEGGDNHFRPEFLKELRRFADENEALLIFDEVQTGVGITGTMWAHEQLETKPDIMVFGKKMQICGILATNRVDEIEDNVFTESSRINSTWGGSLVDMVRATRYLELIEEENMLANVRETGKFLMSELNRLCQEYPTLVDSVRGRGLFCAFGMPDKVKRDEFRNGCFKDGLFILACGERSIRFRPRLNITNDELKQGLNIIEKNLKKMI